VIRYECSGVDARLSGLALDERDKRDGDRDDDSNEAPETPLDEPRPPRVQDPPPQPDTKGPYVVQSSSVLTS
jgi:hypothetical protein